MTNTMKKNTSTFNQINVLAHAQSVRRKFASVELRSDFVGAYQKYENSIFMAFYCIHHSVKTYSKSFHKLPEP